MEEEDGGEHSVHRECRHPVSGCPSIAGGGTVGIQWGIVLHESTRFQHLALSAHSLLSSVRLNPRLHSTYPQLESRGSGIRVPVRLPVTM